MVPLWWVTGIHSWAAYADDLQVYFSLSPSELVYAHDEINEYLNILLCVQLFIIEILMLRSLENLGEEWFFRQRK